MNIAVAMCYAGKNLGWLYEAISSLKSEEYLVDVFVHLDGPTVKVDENKFGKNVHFVRSDKNVGFANGINKCLMAISKHPRAYAYIARMDDDDICLPYRLDHQVKFMLENPTVDFSGTLASIIDETGRVSLSDWHYAEETGIDMAQRFLEGGCHIVHASCIFKASMLYDHNHLWYNPLYIAVEDYDLWFRLLRQGYKYKVLPERLYLYRVHSNQETRNPKQAQRMKLCENTHAFYKQNWSMFCTN